MPPIEINGQTYYTADEVRAEYVPKAEHLERLKAKDAKAAETAETALRASRDAAAAAERVRALEAQVGEVEGLRSSLRAAHDQAALARAGVSDAALPYLRLAHSQRIEGLPEAERPADVDADFRQWLTAAEGGAKANEFVGHYFKAAAAPAPAPAAQVQGQAAGQAPAPTPAPARVPAPAPPSTVTGAAPPASSEAQRQALANLQARYDALASQYASTPASQRAALKPQIEAAQAALAAATTPAGQVS
jgi:hypothetical protein